MNRYGFKPKQLLIPMELYQRILERCAEERDTNESRMILKLIQRALNQPYIPQEVIDENITPLLIDATDNRPEIVRLREIFPNNEPEVQKQLKEIEQGLREAGETDDNIRLILYGETNE